MDRIFRTVSMHDGVTEMTGLKIGDHIFVTLYDKTNAEILAIKLNRLLEESKAAESLPSPCS